MDQEPELFDLFQLAKRRGLVLDPKRLIQDLAMSLPYESRERFANRMCVHQCLDAEVSYLTHRPLLNLPDNCFAQTFATFINAKRIRDPSYVENPQLFIDDLAGKLGGSAQEDMKAILRLVDRLHYLPTDFKAFGDAIRARSENGRGG